jgi:uncharacterized membrane protein
MDPKNFCRFIARGFGADDFERSFMKKSSQNLESLELRIAKILRYGVLVAGLFLLIGWAAQINFSKNIFNDFHDYQSSPLLGSLELAWRQGAWGSLTAYAGLLILICLPLLRVVMTGAVFLKQKDYIMAAVVGLVLMGLVISIGLGFEV